MSTPRSRTEIFWHFEVLKCKSHLTLHEYRESISFCNNLQSDIFLLELKHLESSANSATVAFWTVLGMSFIYKRNKSGPNTEPCGTPDTAGSQSELRPSTTTLCWRLCKWDLNQPSKSEWKPKDCSLWIINSWETLQKLLKNQDKLYQLAQHCPKHNIHFECHQKCI